MSETHHAERTSVRDVPPVAPYVVLRVHDTSVPHIYTCGLSGLRWPEIVAFGGDPDYNAHLIHNVVRKCLRLDTPPGPRFVWEPSDDSPHRVWPLACLDQHWVDNNLDMAHMWGTVTAVELLPDRRGTTTHWPHRLYSGRRPAT